jgi:hypothetical protein
VNSHTPRSFSSAAAFGLFGPVTTVLADAVSYLLSAAGIRAIGGTEPRPARTGAARLRDLSDGWRYILANPALRACWPVGLAFIGTGPAGLVLVMAIELGLIASVGVFTPPTQLAISALR